MPLSVHELFDAATPVAESISEQLSRAKGCFKSGLKKSRRVSMVGPTAWPMFTFAFTTKDLHSGLHSLKYLKFSVLCDYE